MFTYLNDNSSGIQSLLAIIAALAGIAWWYSRREHLSRANIDVGLETVSLGSRGHLLRVLISIENIGQRIISVQHMDVFVQQISPVPESFELKYAGNSHEYDWPLIAGGPVSHSKPQEFEPGERGTLTFDYTLSELPETASVYVHVQNASVARRLIPFLGKKRQIGWHTTKLVRFSHAP